MPDVLFYGILFIIYQEKLIVYDKSGKIFSKKAGKRRKKTETYSGRDEETRQLRNNGNTGEESK